MQAMQVMQANQQKESMFIYRERHRKIYSGRRNYLHRLHLLQFPLYSIACELHYLQDIPQVLQEVAAHCLCDALLNSTMGHYLAFSTLPEGFPRADTANSAQAAGRQRTPFPDPRARSTPLIHRTLTIETRVFERP